MQQQEDFKNFCLNLDKIKNEDILINILLCNGRRHTVLMVHCMLAGGSCMGEGVKRMKNVVECFQDQSVL